MKLYDELQAAGLPMDNHYSDLYVKDCPEARRILAKYPVQNRTATRFRCAINREMWIDIPFAFLPYWRKKQGD